MSGLHWLPLTSGKIIFLYFFYLLFLAFYSTSWCRSILWRYRCRMRTNSKNFLRIDFRNFNLGSMCFELFMSSTFNFATSASIFVIPPGRSWTRSQNVEFDCLLVLWICLFIQIVKVIQPAKTTERRRMPLYFLIKT